MLLKIKVIIRDPSNSKKYIGEDLKINLKKLFKVKTKKKIARRKTRRKFTTLKSPHAHKDAQTSFELVSYNYIFKLKANTYFQYTPVHTLCIRCSLSAHTLYGPLSGLWCPRAHP